MAITSVAFKRHKFKPPTLLQKFFIGIQCESLFTDGAGTPFSLSNVIQPHISFRPSDYETGERITPSNLEDHRRTHHFMAPCCLCAITMDDGYIESKLGLVLIGPGAHRSQVNGEYVAQCARNKCGYFGTTNSLNKRRPTKLTFYMLRIVPLERFYPRKVLQVKAYPKRSKFIQNEAPFAQIDRPNSHPLDSAATQLHSNH
jgi:hypothetical protein